MQTAVSGSLNSARTEERPSPPSNHPDPLDISQYRMEKLPQKKATQAGLMMQTWGLPVAIISFILLSWFIDIPALDQKAQYMLAVFVAALVLWISEAIPNYLTSMCLTAAVILLGIVPRNTAMATLGHPIIWLNITAFILASALVKTKLAERVALLFVVKFGRNAGSIFLSFIAVNLLLSAFINATAAKAALLMPLFMVVSAVYGASGDDTNNFAKNLILHNLLMINAGCNAYMTGSGANLLAASLMLGAGASLYYFDWLLAGMPITIAVALITYVVGVRFIFPMSKDDRTPKIAGGMQTLKDSLHKLGPVSKNEIKSAVIFLAVLGFWATDKLHGLDATLVALIGAIIMLAPQTKLMSWNEVDIPWHLMLFSAGAYVIGAGLKETQLMDIAVAGLMGKLGMENMSFFAIYAIITGLFIASHFIFQSKTMRAMIFIPITISIANTMGFDILSLALPVALCINVCWTFPFNSKPAAILYCTNKYTMGETWRFGWITSLITWVIMLIAGQTWLNWIGVTPGFF